MQCSVAASLFVLLSVILPSANFLLTTESIPGCVKKITKVCPNCCALMYDTPECEDNSRFYIKRGANGFIGKMWEKRATIVEVRPGCLFSLWEGRNKTGASRKLGLDDIDLYFLDRYAFEQRTVEVTCFCNRRAY